MHMKMCILDQQNIIILNIQRSQLNKSSKKTVLDWQVANRMSDKYIINAAYQKLNIDNGNNEINADSTTQSGMFEKAQIQDVSLLNSKIQESMARLVFILNGSHQNKKE